VINVVTDEAGILKDLDLATDSEEIFTKIRNNGILSVEVAVSVNDENSIKSQIFAGDDITITFTKGGVSEESKDFAWLGRNVKAIGKRTFSKDPETPGKRIYEEAEWEDRENQATKEKYKILLKGKRVWDYIIPVNEENTKLMKSLVGDIGLNQITTFQMLKGTTYPISVDEDTFFKTPVDEVMKNHIEKIVRIKNTSSTKKE